MRRIKYAQLSETVDKTGFTSWVRPEMKRYFNRCCDCGLVHEYKFTVEGKNVFFKVKRDNRRTAQSRRMKKYKQGT
jgi:hypothetical protein